MFCLICEIYDNRGHNDNNTYQVYDDLQDFYVNRLLLLIWESIFRLRSGRT